MFVSAFMAGEFLPAGELLRNVAAGELLRPVSCCG